MPKKIGSTKFINSVKVRNKDTIKYLDEIKGIKYLHKEDFIDGTYRITKPGKYKLYENIYFNPNRSNNSKPRNNQNTKYPKGAYILGFFAVIAIEVSNVELDLNGYSIDVSEEFNQNQRFASIIELGNSPFNNNQGPANFGKLNQAPSYIFIHNGRIGRSPHHGIRGNNNDKLVLKNIVIDNFEVAAISLHGCTNSLIENISIKGNSKNVHSLSQYSQCLFILPFLKKIMDIDENYSFDNKSVKNIYNTLTREITLFKNSIFKREDYNGFFKNVTKIPDGNVYGILLHTKGVAVGEMLEQRDENTVGNENITIRNVNIENIISQSIEIKALRRENAENKISYVGKFITGPVGDVIKINKIMNDKNIYIGDPLSDAQFIIAKRKNNFNGEKYGTVSISNKLIDWAEKKYDFNDLNLYMERDHDSMGHFMKGNHGILVSCGKDIRLYNININNVINYGEDDNRLLDRNTRELEKSGHILKEVFVKKNINGLGVHFDKNNNGVCSIISDFKRMPNNHTNECKNNLLLNDEIIKINDKNILSSSDLSHAISDIKKGDQLRLIISRDLKKDVKDTKMMSKLSTGICFTGCDNVDGSNLNINNVISKYGENSNILQKNVNTNINI